MMLTYLRSMWLGAHPASEVGTRNNSEMEMLAGVIDKLLEGDLAGVGDRLMQRFRCLQMVELTDGEWRRNSSWHRAKTRASCPWRCGRRPCDFTSATGSSSREFPRRSRAPLEVQRVVASREAAAHR